jgi:2-oxoglutarate ferredoxin oxidoreductase subunit gamma
MQRSVVMSGIGGQGIVVGTTLLGHAATRNGQFAVHFAQYGGEMRGTKCECTLTISDEQVNAPPLVSEPDVAIIMHPNPPTRLHGTAAESFQAITSTVRPGGLAIVNSSLLDLHEVTFRPDIEWLLIPVTDIGKQLGHLMVASMVAISAFAAETRMVPVEYIRLALTDVIPAYRHQLLEMDDAGLTAGERLVTAGTEFNASRDARGDVQVAAFPDTIEHRTVRIPSTGTYAFRAAVVV